MVKLSIIIISYNTKEMTLACIRSVFSETKNVAYEIIVLDNASSDGSAEAMKDEFGTKIKLIASEQNHGFAQGNNIAAESASGEYLLLLNPDTVVLENAIDRLLDFVNDFPNAKIWGGRTLFGDKSLNPGSCWAKQSLWGLSCQALGLSSLFRKFSIFNPEGMGGWNRDGIREVDIVCGCFLLLKLQFWHELRGFRKEFFMYGEEADLCLRAKSLGANPMVTSKATIIHYGGASEKIRADKLVRLLTAKMLLIEFHFTNTTKALGKWLLYMWPKSRYFAHTMLSMFGRKKSIEAAQSWKQVLSNASQWYI